jgi:hypothetical protein
MGNDNPIVGVLKFGSRQHLEQLATGRLHMNTLEYFIKLETCSLRGDSHEGTSHIFRGDGAKLHIKIEGQFRPVAELRGPMRHRSDENLKVNVFCMYALRESPSGIFVDPRNFDFGDAFAILSDFDEFIKRVQAAVAGTGQLVQWGPVEYIDLSSYAGPVGIFRKDSSFSYQSELRLALLPGYGSKHELEVGDISDIVRIGASEDLQHIKLQRYPEAENPPISSA